MFGHKYPRVHQLGFVVEDMEKAMYEYAKIYHVKKWYRAANDPPGKVFYKGQYAPDEGFYLVIGYCGNTEIELITSTAKDNIYVDFLRENGPGFHHISYFVSNLDQGVQDYLDIGFEVVQTGSLGSKTVQTRNVYLKRPEDHYGNIIEIQETRLLKIFPVYRSSFMTWIGSFTGGSLRIKLPGL